MGTLRYGLERRLEGATTFSMTLMTLALASSSSITSPLRSRRRTSSRRLEFETLEAVDRLLPGRLGEGSDEPLLPERALLRLARQHGTIVRMERGIGEFVVKGTIVDMALRALSPGINDTTTAVMCVDHLSAILTRLASRRIPSARRREEGTLRVVRLGPSFASLTADSFDESRRPPQEAQ